MGYYSRKYDRFIGQSTDDYNKRKADEVLGCFMMSVWIIAVITLATWLASIFGLS